MAAIELIHRQPVRWTHEQVVACDGGGGPAGHPRIFINTDKPEIATCGYCGLPFVSRHYYYRCFRAALHREAGARIAPADCSSTTS